MEWTLLLPIVFAVIVSALGFLAYRFWQRQQAIVENRFRNLEQNVRQLTDWSEDTEDPEEEDEDEEDEDEENEAEADGEDCEDCSCSAPPVKDPVVKCSNVGDSVPALRSAAAAATLKQFMVSDNLFSILPSLSVSRQPPPSSVTIREVTDIPVTELSDQE